MLLKFVPCKHHLTFILELQHCTIKCTLGSRGFMLSCGLRGLGITENALPLPVVLSSGGKTSGNQGILYAPNFETYIGSLRYHFPPSESNFQHFKIKLSENWWLIVKQVIEGSWCMLVMHLVPPPWTTTSYSPEPCHCYDTIQVQQL